MSTSEMPMVWYVRWSVIGEGDNTGIVDSCVWSTEALAQACLERATTIAAYEDCYLEICRYPVDHSLEEAIRKGEW